MEHSTENAGEISSILALGTQKGAVIGNGHSPARMAMSGSGSVVEHLLAKVRAVGSNPIFRSKLYYSYSSPGPPHAPLGVLCKRGIAYTGEATRWTATI